MSKEQISNYIQWCGAFFIMLGQALVSYFPASEYIATAFMGGNISFLIAFSLLKNKPMMVMNTVLIIILIT